MRPLRRGQEPYGERDEIGETYFTLSPAPRRLHNNSASPYRWRKYGNYGIINGKGTASPADPYPSFYIYELLQYFARGGEAVGTTVANTAC